MTVIASVKTEVEISTYAFRFQNEIEHQAAQLGAIGRQYKTDQYILDGATRRIKNFYVFQYTLSGYGLISMNGVTHKSEPGSGFFVEIPSNHVYWIPGESSHWQFLFIDLLGNEAERMNRWFLERGSPVCQLAPSSAPIRTLIDILEQARTDRISDEYAASILAYQFLMELRRELTVKKTTAEHLPESIAAAVAYMQTRYGEQLQIEDIARMVGLSPHHFTRYFRKHMNTSPIQFLTKVRIERAIELLRDRELSVEVIADLTGFTSSNYFIQVFRQIVGVSPGQFRKESYDRLLLK